MAREAVGMNVNARNARNDLNVSFKYGITKKIKPILIVNAGHGKKAFNSINLRIK